MKTGFIFSLTATLLSLGLTQPALSATSVAILQCSVVGTTYVATAASDGQNVRNVVIGNPCALELEEYLNLNVAAFRFRSILGNGSNVTYTLVRP